MAKSNKQNLTTVAKLMKSIGLAPTETNLPKLFDCVEIDIANTRHKSGWETDNADGRKDLHKLLPKMLPGYSPLRTAEPKYIVFRTLGDGKYGILCGRRRWSLLRLGVRVHSGQATADKGPKDAGHVAGSNPLMTATDAAQLVKTILPSPAVAPTADGLGGIDASDGWEIDVRGVIDDAEARYIAVDNLVDETQTEFTPAQLLGQRLQLHLLGQSWEDIERRTNGERRLAWEARFCRQVPTWVIKAAAELTSCNIRVTNSIMDAWGKAYNDYRKEVDPGYDNRNPERIPVEMDIVSAADPVFAEKLAIVDEMVRNGVKSEGGCKFDGFAAVVAKANAPKVKPPSPPYVTLIPQLCDLARMWQGKGPNAKPALAPLGEYLLALHGQRVSGAGVSSQPEYELLTGDKLKRLQAVLSAGLDALNQTAKTDETPQVPAEFATAE